MSINTVYLIHAPDPDHLKEVKAEMQRLGAPTIRVVDCGDYYMALEGAHRLTAAHELGLAPNLVVYDQEVEIDVTIYDWYDAANWDRTIYSAGEVAGELYSPHSARDLWFDEVAVESEEG